MDYKPSQDYTLNVQTWPFMTKEGILDFLESDAQIRGVSNQLY